MSKPEYADELIHKFSSLRDIMEVKKSIWNKIKELMPEANKLDMEGYAELIEKIPYSIDSVYKELGLTCKDELIQIISDTIRINEGTGVVKSNSISGESVLLLDSMLDTTVTDAITYCPNLINLSLIVPDNCRFTNSLTGCSRLNEISLNFQGVSQININSSTVKKLFFNNYTYRYITSNDYTAPMFNIPNAESVSGTIIIKSCTQVWMQNSFFSSTVGAVDVRYKGSLDYNLVNPAGVVRTYYLPPNATSDCMFSLLNILKPNPSSLYRFSGYIGTNSFYLTNINKQRLIDEGKYQEFLDGLKQKGWQTYTHYKGLND